MTLPELGISAIKAKVDTGARTSSLHAFAIRRLVRRGQKLVRFQVHPLQRNPTRTVLAEVPMVDERWVRSSSGEKELRPVIATRIELLGKVWLGELTLSSRDEMGFRMLLGRQALRGLFVVDPGRSFVAGRRGGRRRTIKARKKKSA